MNPNDSLIELQPNEPHLMRYYSGRVVLAETFSDGRLLSNHWSASGQVWPDYHWQPIKWAPEQPADAFRLSIDNRDLCGGYTLAAVRETPDPSTWRGEGRPVRHSEVTLRHAAAEVEVTVHTRIDGGPFIIRWLAIRNLGRSACAVTAAAPFAGALWNQRINEHLPSPQELPFRAAWTHLPNGLQEGDFYWDELQPGVLTMDGGRMGRSGWGRPAFWAYNRGTGQTAVCELAWGGSYQWSLDCRITDERNWHTMSQTNRLGALYFSMGLAGSSPALRVLTPGEVVYTPAVHLGLFQEDYDAIVQASHTHVREVVLPKQLSGRELEIEANHRGYLCDRENEPDMKKDIDVAASLGAELYVVDAGWYGADPNRWPDNAGDWWAGSWLPNGLEPVAEHAHARGLKFGLWVEIEAAGANSALKREHPDWLLRYNGQPVSGGRALDFSQGEVAAWAEGELERVIRQYKLDMYRLDHNNLNRPFGNCVVDGFTEDLQWRYYDNLYAMFDRLRAQHPEVVFQNCAGGGGRTDWGTMHRFHNTEASDWLRLPRTLKITNGLTMSLPPETLLRTCGTEVGEMPLDGDLDAQIRQACLGRPILRGIAPSLDSLTPWLRARLAHTLDIYREVIRPLLVGGALVYHHTPFLPIDRTTDWCVLEYAAPDKSHAVIGLFRTSDAADEVFTCCPRGLDAGATYRLTLDNASQSCLVSGWELAQRGVRVRLGVVQSSELLILERVE
ncbi:MAG: alpha-galactosidase [Chloroflexi bacterium]|nr:alpha-galactosidase [Chloroflexota bacterium]